jgi:hypothetical protein
MRAAIIAILLLLALLAPACTPQYNWRQTAITGTGLQTQFPCKPERAVRQVRLGGQPVQLSMASCTVADVSVAVGHAALVDPAGAGAVLLQWQQATLATMRATGVRHSPLRLRHATDVGDAVLVHAQGTGPDARPLVLQAAWFASGNSAFVAMLYGPVIQDEVAETFFAALRLP